MCMCMCVFKTMHVFLSFSYLTPLSFVLVASASGGEGKDGHARGVSV